MEFIKNIGMASTSASLGSLNLGHNVNAALYADDKKRIVILESGGERIDSLGDRGIHTFETDEDYIKWEESRGDLNLMLHGLRLFSCTTAFDSEEYQQNGSFFDEFASNF